jgi:branched-chain amino acid aminotransferase
VTDDGLLRGDGVFEVVRLYGGRPFALEEHLQRLARSAANLRLAVDEEAVRREIAALLREAGPVDGALRVLVTRGGRRVVIVEPIKPLPDTLALATITFAPTRILDAVKSLSYAGNMLASRLAREAGADEALLVTPHGRVLEAPTAAFFYSLDGKRLHVPPLDDHVLDSITRRRVVALMGAEERITTRDDLQQVREAFLASTTREVHPVHAIDGRALPGEGALTAAAARAVRERIVAELLAEPTA